LIQGVIEREFKQHHGAQEKLDAAKAEQRKLEKTEHEAIIADLLAHQDMQRLAAAWGNAADREVTALNPDVLKPKEAGTAPASPEQDIESHDRIDRAIEKLPDH
jgi:hypothetical protein